jgi:MYXO-CTERM domain-containing protein
VVETSAPTIFGGALDDDPGSSTVALKVGEPGAYELCSGAVVAPNVVLTARHCVAKAITTTVSCDENGHSTNGAHVAGNRDPREISVYGSAEPKFNQTADALGSAIISPTSEELCDSDIALVVLDHALPKATPLAVRLSTTVEAGEKVNSIGYGQNDKLLPMGTRFMKADVPILAMGRGVSESKTALGPHEFEVGKSICQGDSGGPAISQTTGAIIGVVSRGSDCDLNFGHIYTTTAGWSDLFTQAFEVAGGAPVLESGSDSPSRHESTAPTASSDGGHAQSCSFTTTPGRSPSPSCVAVVALALVAAARRRRTSRNET